MKQDKSWLVKLLASLSLISSRSGKIYTACKETAIRLAESCDLVSVAYLKCLYARLETVKSSMQFVVVVVASAAVCADETNHQDGKMLSKETIDGAASSSTSALPVAAGQSTTQQQQNNDVQMRDTTTSSGIESITKTSVTDDIDREDEDENEADEEEDSIYDTKPIWVNLEPSSRETTDEHATTAAATDNGDFKLDNINTKDDKSRLDDVKSSSREVDEDPVRYSETCRDIYEFAKLVVFLGEIMCSSSVCRHQIVSHLKVKFDYLDLKSK